MTITSVHDETTQLRKKGKFAGNIPTAPPATTTLTPALAGAERTVAEADADLEAIDAQLVELTAQRAQANREALALSVREKFADAQTIHFQYVAFQGKGITLTSVTDEAGRSLWDLKELTETGKWEQAYEWQQSLSKYVLSIDHHNDKALTKSAEKHFGCDLDLGPSSL